MATHDDEIIPAIAYKRALVPVLKTFLKMLKADALFLWEIFDDQDNNKAKYLQKISPYEKQHICVDFYDTLAEKQKSIINELLGNKFKHDKEQRSFGENMAIILKDDYSILKFTSAITNEDIYEPLEFGFGEEIRPKKYVVLKENTDNSYLFKIEYNKERQKLFNKTKSKGNLKAVKLEGITAYHARTNSEGLYTKDLLTNTYQDISIGLNHERIIIHKKDGRGNIDRCEQLCVFPIVLEGIVIGVLKADIYNTDKNFDKNGIELIQACLSFFAQFIINSRLGIQALTYEELCKGSNLEKLLMLIKEEKLESDNAIDNLLNRTIHLFNVFNRKTYIGWAEISGRINHYLNEIRPLIELPNDFDILGKFEEIGKYDELLLQVIPQYREHFVHQFHTFILGLIIILKLKIENFVKWTNLQLATRSKLFNDNHVPLDNISIIRIWFLTCFFHDYAYILQQFDKVMGQFIGKILGIDFIDVHNEWSQLFTKYSSADTNLNKSRFSNYLVEMASYFVSGQQNRNKIKSYTRPEKLVNVIWSTVITRQSHGPLSAFVLLDTLLKEDVKDSRKDEIYLAALSIAAHHKDVYKQIASIGGEHFLTLEGFPFLYLLVYCDSAQEWGRRKQNKTGIEYSSPFLDNIEIINDEVITTICYDSSNPSKIPDSEFISDLEEPIISSFKSTKYSFVIKYKKQNFNKKQNFGNHKPKIIDVGSIRFPKV